LEEKVHSQPLFGSLSLYLNETPPLTQAVLLCSAAALQRHDVRLLLLLLLLLLIDDDEDSNTMLLLHANSPQMTMRLE